jgi:acyl dehydratase
MSQGTIERGISDGQLEEARKQVGVKRGREYEEWELDDARVLRSQVRGWSVMVGNMAPLFVDPEHASRSPWGGLIAPPGVVVCYEQIDPEVDVLPGSVAVLASARVEWDGPIRVGETVLPESELTGVREITEEAGQGRIVAQEIVTEVRDGSGRRLGRAQLEWHGYERGSAAHRGLFGEREDAHYYTREDIEALGEEYKREVARGATPLYWEEVSVGEELAPVLKGPTTRTKYLGRMSGNWYWGHLQGWEEEERRPELFFENENSAPEPVAAVDWVHHRAQRWGGLPGALEVNTERVHHLVQLLMNWMGDSGFPQVLEVRFPVQNMVGDVTRSYGRVTGKEREGDAGVVTLEVWQENQRGERVTSGTARVVLPRGGARG